MQIIFYPPMFSGYIEYGFCIHRQRSNIIMVFRSCFSSFIIRSCIFYTNKRTNTFPMDKLALRQKMIDDANSTITEAKQRLAEMKYEHSRMQEVLGEDWNLHSVQLQRNMLATFNSMLVSSLEPLNSTFTYRQQEILNESGYSDLMRNSNSIINCAMLLSLGYISEATTYAESCGGGGSPGSGWGRDKDEDDDHWWRRCIAVSVAMMRPAKYRLRRGR